MQAQRTLMLIMAIVLLAVPATHAGRWSIVPAASPLEYYVQVGLGLPDLGTLIAPIDPTGSTGTFGRTQLFAFNVTKGMDAASTLLGSMRGYAVQASATADFHGVEVEVLAYHDGSFNGTISLQGLINAGTNEIAIVGGTGDFRGACGYGIITLLNSTATLALYHHQLFFL
ncbi:hypothetical protein L7F22_052405 [Adiantum nelumboides]|nr:hypothetical protein [Adiantum nelumboides]MCO5598312.1 hypothetical protein [Adiantum nelumboides]